MTDPVTSPSPLEPADPVTPAGRDARLFERFQNGDREAFGELLEHYRPLLERAVRIGVSARIGRFYESSDFVQQGICTALQSVETVQPRDLPSFRGWLRKLMANVIRDFVRRAEAEKRAWDRQVSDVASTSDPDALLTERAVGREPTPSRLGKVEEYQRMVDQAISRLPENEREALLLRLYYQLPWQAVADALGCASANAAQKLEERARLRLRGILGVRHEDLPTGLGQG